MNSILLVFFSGEVYNKKKVLVAECTCTRQDDCRTWPVPAGRQS
jgi:hypothetical protein